MKKFLKRFFASPAELYEWHQNLENATKHQFVEYLEQCRLHIAATELRTQTNKEILDTVRFILKRDESLRHFVLNELQK